jgi:hypothetical protein
MSSSPAYTPAELRDLDQVGRLQVWTKKTLATPVFPYVVLSSDRSSIVDEINAMGVKAAVVKQRPGLDALMPLSYAKAPLRVPLTDFMFSDIRAERMQAESPRELPVPLKTRTERLLHSMQSIELIQEHINCGSEGPYLRDFGFSPSVSGTLIEWGYERTLVATFENKTGGSNNHHCWEPRFLMDFCEKHLELFGSADLPENFIQWAECQRQFVDAQRMKEEFVERSRG